MYNNMVSVIVPVYNTAEYLTVCVESLINQTYKHLEIILVDDGSSDGSEGICDDYAKKDSRITVLHKKNAGVSAARNSGLDRFSGEYVLFVDADDYLELNAVEILVDTAERSKADAVIFDYYIDYSNGLKKKIEHHDLHGSIAVKDAVYYSITPINRFAVTKLYSRQLVVNLRFDKTIHLGEDTLFTCYALANGNSVFYLDKALYHYYQSADSATRQKEFNKRLLTGKDAYYKLMQLCNEKFPSIAGAAVAEYCELLMTLIVQMSNDKQNDKYIRGFALEIKKYAATAKKSSYCKLSEKIKITLCNISPYLMITARKISRKGK